MARQKFEANFLPPQPIFDESVLNDSNRSCQRLHPSIIDNPLQLVPNRLRFAMAPNRRRLDLPPPPPIDLNELKTTQSMRTSLQNLYSCLLCPLCNQTFRNPVTLPACAHTFCQECISDYACNSYECPACSLPIMLRGGRAGKFDQTNPQIETVTSSFVNLCHALNTAPNHWWRSSMDS